MSNIKIKSKNLNVYYGQKQALFDVNLDINEKEVTALMVLGMLLTIFKKKAS